MFFSTNFIIPTAIYFIPSAKPCFKKSKTLNFLFGPFNEKFRSPCRAPRIIINPICAIRTIFRINGHGLNCPSTNSSGTASKVSINHTDLFIFELDQHMWRFFFKYILSTHKMKINVISG